ncbi:MAG: AI-2E family transporter [Roseibium sp.]
MQNDIMISNQYRTAALVILGICGLLALLVYGRGFLAPIVIACLLTTLISAGISKLESYGLPNWAAMLVSIGGAFLLIYGAAQVSSSQITIVSEALPKYSVRFDGLLVDLTAFLGQQQVDQIRTAFSNMDFSGHAATFAESVGGLFGSFGLILMYSGFLLAERGMLLNKLAFLFPDPEKSAEIQELFRTVGFGIRRYMWIKTVVSLLTGILCYAILAFIGIDFAEILSILIFLLNFIPTIGSIVAVILPAVVALMQFDTLTPFLMVVALCGSVQFVVGSIVEPKFMGTTLNLSPFVVLLSLTFWGTIWGIEGAALSVPIAASIVILCRDIPGLRPIAVMMSVDGDLEKNRTQAPTASTKTAKPKPNTETQEKISALKAELEDLQAEARD